MIAVLLVAAAAAAPQEEAAGPLRLAAAASLGDVLPGVLEEWHQAGGRPVEVIFGGSGDLATQARHGAPVDAILLAGETPLARLAAAGEILPDSARILLENRLVLVAPAGVAGAGHLPADLGEALAALAGRRVALAGPGAPAGVYARRWLASVAPGTVAAVDLVPFDHVRSVLAAVEGGSCAAGFVYATDASARLAVLLEAPASATGTIRYPAAVLARSPRPRAALDLLRFLETHRDPFFEAGFLAPASPAPAAERPRREAGGGPGSAPACLLLRTLLAGLAAVLVELPFALLLGRLLARRRFRGRALVQTLLVLPMFLPPVAVGLLLLLALGPGGPLAFLGPALLYREGALVLAAAAISFPLLLRHAEEAFAAVPVRLSQVAASLGAGRWRILWSIELPLARRGLAAGALLAFARGVGEYGATAVVAGVVPGRTETLATGLYRRLSVGDDAAALGLAGISIALGFFAVLASELLLRSNGRGGAR